MVTGTGISTDPYMIYNLADLTLVGNGSPYAATAYYELANDIDASATSGSGYNGGAGWIPLGSAGNRFGGDFNGNGYAISGLFINNPLNNTPGQIVGLFGYIANPGKVHDLILDCNITGYHAVGGIAGYSYVNENGTNVIYNCTVHGSITGNDSVGGIIGYKDPGNSIANCNSDAIVSGTQQVGGIIGNMAWGLCNVTDCNFRGSVIGTGSSPSQIGGLIGSYVPDADETSVSTMNGCTVSGIINANGGSRVGGLVGYNANLVLIENSSFSGVINVSGSGYRIGGIVGSNTVPIENCIVTGRFNTDISCTEVGGIAGYNNSTITSCKCRSNITGSTYVGGLIGQDGNGTISNCSFDGNITASLRAGGLIGETHITTISQCYSMGTITATGGQYIGGLVGVMNPCNVNDCYSLMNVVGGDGTGGFAGYIGNSALVNCYTAGSVSGTSNTGGFSGYATGTSITDCFWDSQASGQTIGNVGISELTSAMQTEATFTGFDFTTVPVWNINPSLNGGYPYLASTPLPPTPITFYGSILNTSSIAGKVTEGSAFFISVYGSILNTSSIAGKVTEELESSNPLIYGHISNTSSLTPEIERKSYLKSSISNLSTGKWWIDHAHFLIGGSVANNSIMKGRFNLNSSLGMIIYNNGWMLPYISGDLVYFNGAILNKSEFNPTLPNNTYYLIENVAGDVINGITFEPAYQGSKSAVQTIILQNTESNPDLTVNISAYSGLVPEQLQNASENSYQYINLSSTGNTGDWHDNIEVIIPSGGSVKFYIQADYPSSAVAGGFICGLNTTVTVNSGTYSQNLMLGGTVLTGNPVIQTAGKPNAAIIAEMGNNNYNAITKFTISDKINVAAKTFEIDYSTPLTPEDFVSGTQVILAQAEVTMLNGNIQDAEEDANPGNHTFVLTGRDQAQALVNQSFTCAMNCPVAPGSGSGVSDAVLMEMGTYPSILDMILENTPIQIGASVNIVNSWNTISFCGSWSTKKIAIDYFFYLLAQNTGQELCWYVDNDGFLQTFDVSNPGAIALSINMDDPSIRTLKFVDNSENVVNRITAYGGTNNSISVTVDDTASQAIYGIIEGPNLQDCSLTTQAEVQAAAEAQLALNCNPVYTATIILPQFPGAVSGQPVLFPGHPKYGNTTFIISEVVRTGVQANYTTTITATTDPNVISPMESFDMVQIVAQNTVAQSLPQVGVVSAVGDGVATLNTVGGVVSANTLDQTDSSSSNSSSGGSGGAELLNS